MLPEPYESFEAMLADERVDVVHITSPNKAHFPQAKAALAAGKHVVCEKPLAMTSAETGELLELARASGLVHAVNFNIRFYSQNIEAHERVKAGEIGRVHQVTGSDLQDWLLLDTDWNWRLDPAEGGQLRAVGDIGSHWIDLLQYVTGRRVEAVMADLATVIPVRRVPTGPVETFAAGDAGERVEKEITTEDTAAIMLRLDGGARAVCAISQLSAGRRNACSFQVGHRDRPNEILLRDPSLQSPPAAAAQALPPGHLEGFADTFRELYRAVYREVERGGPPERADYPTFADGHDEALIADAIAASAREGRWVEVDRAATSQEVTA